MPLLNIYENFEVICSIFYYSTQFGGLSRSFKVTKLDSLTSMAGDSDHKAAGRMDACVFPVCVVVPGDSFPSSVW